MNPRIMDAVGFIGRLVADDYDALLDQNDIKEELMNLGFSNKEISYAFKWIENTTLGHLEDEKPRRRKAKQNALVPKIQPPFRKMDALESAKMRPKAQGLLLGYYNRGLLDPILLEDILEKIMKLNLEEVSEKEVRRITALVLFGRVQGDWRELLASQVH